MNNVFPLRPMPANDNDRPVHSMKDLLCEACGERPWFSDGLCPVCIAEQNAVIDDRKATDDWDGDDSA